MRRNISTTYKLPGGRQIKAHLNHNTWNIQLMEEKLNPEAAVSLNKTLLKEVANTRVTFRDLSGIGTFMKRVGLEDHTRLFTIKMEDAVKSAREGIPSRHKARRERW